jgi:hypothetical protein
MLIRGASRGPELALVPVLSAVVHRAKSRQSSLAEQAGVHLHGTWRKEQRLHDRSTPVWHLNPVRRDPRRKTKNGGRKKDNGG